MNAMAPRDRRTFEAVDPLTSAAEAAGIGIWHWDLLTGVMTLSERAKEIFGLPPLQPVTFQMVVDAVHPDDIGRTLEASERSRDPAIRQKKPFEYRVIWPDGSAHWVLSHGEAVFEEVDGVVQAVRQIGTLQDVTKQQEAAEALR